MASDVGGAGAGLTSATAVRLLKLACEAVGLDDRGAVLIRVGENALFRLASAPVVVRIARSAEYLPEGGQRGGRLPCGSSGRALRGTSS